MVLDHYFTPFFFPWPTNYITHLDVPNFPLIHHQIDFDQKKIPFFEFIASQMTTFYELQVIQMNEEPP
jgi:hypothetical protein